MVLFTTKQRATGDCTRFSGLNTLSFSGSHSHANLMHEQSFKGKDISVPLIGYFFPLSS